MHSTEGICLTAGLSLLALIALGLAARIVVAGGLVGLGFNLASRLEAARLAHLAIALVLRGLVPLLAR